MKLVRIKIKRLFGSLNPDISLDSNIKIIYGKNGTGKTTILSIINSILSGSLYELRSIRFQEVLCSFSDGSDLTIRKANDNRSPATRRDQLDKRNLLVIFRDANNKTHEEFLKHDSQSNLGIPPDIIDREIPELERIGHREWRSLETGETLSINDIVDLYGYRYPWIRPKNPKAWYSKLVHPFEVRFIQSQRLVTYSNKIERSRLPYREARINHESTVARYSNELRTFARDLMSESAQIAQKLDSTFPSRLLDKSIPLEYNQEIIASLEKKVESLRAKLESSGLIEPTNVLKIDQDSISDADQRTIFLYLSDSLSKHQVFDELEQKISLFTDILNRKFDGKKFVVFSRTNGLEFFGKGQEKLNPRLLSSGEQHEIILMYDLIFKSTKDMLVLIDEPEISLHIDWQLEFIADLESVAKVNSPQFIIATHSPAIIGNRIALAQEI